MKKFLLVLLVISVAITVAACTKNKQKEKTTSLPDISNNGSDYAEEYSGIVSDTDFYTISPEDTITFDEDDTGNGSGTTTTKKGSSSETTTKKGSSQTTTKQGSESGTTEKSDDGSFTTPIIPIG